MIQKQHFKNRTLAAVLLLLMAMLPQLASASDFMLNGLCYNCNSDGTSVTVTSGGNYTGAVNIPSTVTYNGNTYSVTSIGDVAFWSCSGLTSVTIPNSVTMIGHEAFSNCTGLTSVIIPNSVTSIGDVAFWSCSGLTSMVVESGNTKYDSRNNCNAIIETATNTLISGCKNTIIPNSVRTIGNYAFFGCSGLTSVTIPNSVTEIGGSAFKNCTGLTSIAIPNSVTTIGGSAFYNCTGLTSIAIPNSVTAIGNYAFYGCTGLTSVTWNAKNCMNFTSSDYAPFKGLTGITSFVLGDEVEHIPAYLCEGLTGLTSVTIPNSVTTIPYSCFSNCSGLTSVTIPNSVTAIRNYAFYGCTGLTSVTWNAKNCMNFSSSDYAPFKGLTGITSFILGDEVESIPNYLCFGLNGLTSVTIPNSVTTIGDRAFNNCTGLTSIAIPNSVTTIGGSAFSGCTGLTNIYSHIINPNNVTLGSSVFYNVPKSSCFLIVPGESVNLYKAANQWKDFSKIKSWVSSVSLNNAQMQMLIGKTETLVATVLPNDAYNKTLNWSSSNPSVATVDQTGKVTAKALGTATITVTTTDGTNLAASCEVTVLPPVSSICLSHNLANIYHSGTLTITATVLPNNANNTLTWYSSNTTVATVDQNGVVTAKALGTATITATATDGSGVSATCVVTVTGITNITLNKSATSIYVGGTETLTATITPNGVINNTLTWSSSNTTVATVDQNGLVTAKKLGIATITATTLDGTNLSASCELTVTGIESISLNKDVTTMYIGDTETLTATISPSDVINGTLNWTSTNTSVATVTQNGLVTAKALGSATIKATATDGSGVSGSCVVTVVPENTMTMDTLVHIRGSERIARTIDIRLDNRRAISGVQFDLTLPNYVELATVDGYLDIWLNDTRKARNHSVDINLIGTKKYRVIVSSPTNKTFKGNEGAILHFNVLVDKYPSTGTGTIKLSDIVLAEPDETQHTIGSVTSDVKFVYLVGDANADIKVDVADYVLTANKIMLRTVSNFYSDAANAYYSDGTTTLNVTDLVAITNIALEIRGKEVRPAISGFQFTPAVAFHGNDFPLTAQVTGADGDKTLVAIAIDNDEAIAAMQLDLDLPDGVTLESAAATDRASGISASCGLSPEGKARVMLSSFGTAEIAEGSGDVIMLTLRGKAQHGDLLQISNVVMPERSLIEHGAVGDLTLDLNDFTGVNGVTYENVNIYGSDGSVIIESPVEGMARLVRINGMSREVKVEPGRNVYPVNVSHGDIIIATFNGVTKKIQF